MNIRPTYQQVIEVIKQSQDNKSLNPKDQWSKFLIQLVLNRTETGEPGFKGEVNTDELAADLKYTIDQFSKALKALEKFN